MDPNRALSRSKEQQLEKIRLMLLNPVNKERVILIVEGDDDKKIFDAFVDKSHTTIVPIGGCLHMIYVLKSINDQYMNRVLAVKDADFDHLGGAEYSDLPNLFITDCHDIEMTIISESFERKLISEYLEGNNEKLIEKAIWDIKNLSLVKWYNYQNQMGIDFSNTKPTAPFYDGNCSLTIERCIEQLKKIAGNIRKVSFDSEQIESFEADNQNIDLYQLSNGHDVCDALATIIRGYNSKNGNINGNKISVFLRMCCDNKVFTKTSLYKNISKWGDAIGFSIWSN